MGGTNGREFRFDPVKAVYATVLPLVFGALFYFVGAKLFGAVPASREGGGAQEAQGPPPLGSLKLKGPEAKAYQNGELIWELRAREVVSDEETGRTRLFEAEGAVYENGAATVELSSPEAECNLKGEAFLLEKGAGATLLKGGERFSAARIRKEAGSALFVADGGIELDLPSGSARAEKMTFDRSARILKFEGPVRFVVDSRKWKEEKRERPDVP